MIFLWALVTAVALPVFFAAGPSRAFAGPVVVDKVAASIQGIGIITSLQLVRYTAVDTVSRNGYDRAALGSSMGNYQHMRASLDRLIDRMLILNDARLLSIQSPKQSAVHALVVQFGKRFSSTTEYDDFMRRYAITPAYIHTFMSEQLVVRRYTEDEIKMLVKVSDVDVRDYYENNKREFNGQGTGEAYRRIRKTLEKKEYDKQLSSWIKTLSLHREIIIMY